MNRPTFRLAGKPADRGRATPIMLAGLVLGADVATYLITGGTYLLH